MKKRIIYTAILILLITTSAYASNEPSKIDSANIIAKANEAIGKKVSNHLLTDQDGNAVRFHDMLRKPLIVSFIYTNCKNICPTISARLDDVKKSAGSDFGNKFNFLTIGFDVANDSPLKLKEFGAHFTSDFANWRFATADKKTMDAIVSEFGFYYKNIKDGFDHMNIVTIVDREGNIYKHIYGLEFKPDDLLVPLTELEKNNGVAPKGIRISGLDISKIVDTIKLVCYRYDESTGTYKIDYYFIMKMTLEGIVILIVFLAVWGRDLYNLFNRLVKRAA